ncbi:MAG: DUF5615 family PIN-like protein [Verrucomicrobiota bacterium]
MKFLIDAQLPEKLTPQLQSWGHDAIHTRYLPSGNRTSDEEIMTVANEEGRILVTRDSDFIESLIFDDKPKQLLFISIGNATNERVLDLVESHMEYLQSAFKTHRVVHIS